MLKQLKSYRLLALFICIPLLAACQTTQETANKAASRNKPVRDKHVASLVEKMARKHNVPTHIAHGVVKAESNYRCNARNPRTGALGVMQTLPATARGVGVHGNLTDCETGMEAGMRYLKMALERGGSGCEGISLYERGIYASPKCTGYGQKVLSYANDAKQDHFLR